MEYPGTTFSVSYGNLDQDNWADQLKESRFERLDLHLARDGMAENVALFWKLAISRPRQAFLKGFATRSPWQVSGKYYNVPLLRQALIGKAFLPQATDADRADFHHQLHRTL